MTKGNDRSTFCSKNHSSAGQTTLIGTRVALRAHDRELRVLYGPGVFLRPRRTVPHPHAGDAGQALKSFTAARKS